MTFITYVLILKIKILRELSMFYQMKKKKKTLLKKIWLFLKKKIGSSKSLYIYEKKKLKNKSILLLLGLGKKKYMSWVDPWVHIFVYIDLVHGLTKMRKNSIVCDV